MCAILSTISNSCVFRLNKIDAWDSIYPCARFNDVQGFFNNFKNASQLRMIFLCKLTAFEITYKPIALQDMYKTAGVNITRSGYTSDIITMDFSPSMAEGIIAYCLSLLCPGDIEIDLDFSNLTSDAIELNGFIALLGRCLLMYDENSVFSNSTDSTQREIDNKIIKWGMMKNILTKRPGNAQLAFPLENYDFKSNNPGNNSQLEGLKLLNDQGGLNCRRRNFK